MLHFEHVYNETLQNEKLFSNDPAFVKAKTKWREQICSICFKSRTQKSGSMLKFMLQFWACQDWKNHRNYINVYSKWQNEVVLAQVDSFWLGPSLSLML